MDDKFPWAFLKFCFCFFVFFFAYCTQIFRREPFFHGRDNPDQLAKIARVLGTDALHRWIDKYGLTITQPLLAMIGRHAPKPFQRFITRECMHLCTSEGLDFLDGLLRYDPADRLTAQEAMAHPYFAPIREQQQTSGSGSGTTPVAAVSSSTAAAESSTSVATAATPVPEDEHQQE
jgi:serine/threonine protein kinase